MRPHPARRRGFTLTELLVAIGLAIVLLSLAVAVSQSSMLDSYRTTGAADKVSQWLLIAKQRALRDKLPRGVRLVVYRDPANPADPLNNTVSECLYIESPNPWFPSNPDVQLVIQQVMDEGDQRTRIDQPPPNGNLPPEQRRVLCTRVFVVGLTPEQLSKFQITGAAVNANAQIQAGDTLSVPELAGRGFKIVGIHTPTGTIGHPAPVGNQYIPGSAARPFVPYIAAAVPCHDSAALRGVNLPPLPGPPMGYANRTIIPAGGEVELELADAPAFTPGYSKFAVTANPWQTSGWPHQILWQNPMSGMGTTPLGPTSMFNPATSAGLELDNQPTATLVTSGFGVYRAARPLLGEPPLRLAKDTVIDLDPTPVPGPPPTYGVYATYTPANGPPLAAGSFVDILFTPAGDLLPNPNASTHPIQVLLVRDITRRAAAVPPNTLPDLRDAGAFEAAGPMALVAVFAKGGTIVTKPVANPQSAPGGDPFLFAKDGIAGGL